MFLKKFKGTGPGVIIMIFFIALILWISAFINPPTYSDSTFETNPMPLYSLLKAVAGVTPFIGVLFSFCMVLLMAFLLVSFNTSEFFISERTFQPAIIYILISGLFPQLQILNPVLPAALFLMLTIRRIMDAYRVQGTAFNFFDAGILLSTGSFFYADLIWFGLLIIIGIALLRTGNVRELSISLLGLATPWIITFGLYYVLGKDIGLFLALVGDNLFNASAGIIIPRITIVALIFLIVLILVSIVHLLTFINSKKIKSRKTFFLLIWEFFISIVLLVILPSASAEILWLTGIAASYFITHYFVFARKKVVPEIFFTGLIILIFLIQILYIF